MSSSFKFHSAVPEIVPWQAQYKFPSQANKIRKQTVKLVPKNGATFAQNQIIRFELPADGYCNMLNTALSFDVVTALPLVPIGADAGLQSIGTPIVSLPRGGAHNYIKRLRILYGSLVLEDIQEYKTLARMFTEMGASKNYSASTSSILNGEAEASMHNVDNPFAVNGTATGASTTQTSATFTSNPIADNNLIQQQMIGGVCNALGNASAAAKTVQATFADIGNDLVAGSSSVTRTFTIQLLSGLLSCKKLLPLKWMASQLAIEITVAPVTESIITNMVVPPTITLQNMNLVTEILEFDSSYDYAFFEGLNKPTGVPIKFSSWHYHQFAVTGTNLTYQIHERSRSVKSAFAVIRQLTPQLQFDADWFFHNLNDSVSPASINFPTVGTPTGLMSTGFTRGGVTTLAALTAAATTATGQAILDLCAPIQQYQWRIGGQYYPAQPVRVSGALGRNATNIIARGEEAFLELQKAIDSLGDGTASGGIHHWNYTMTGTNGYNGEGSKFIMGTSFETPGLGPESVNGINAEEQNDLALYIQGNQSGSTGTTTALAKKLEVFVNFDCLLLVRSGNVVDLVL
jgi:hypothetical protein